MVYSWLRVSSSSVLLHGAQSRTVGYTPAHRCCNTGQEHCSYRVASEFVVLEEVAEDAAFATLYTILGGEIFQKMCSGSTYELKPCQVQVTVSWRKSRGGMHEAS